MNAKVTIEQAGPLWLVFLASSNDPAAPVAIAAGEDKAGALTAAAEFLADAIGGVMELAADCPRPAPGLPLPFDPPAGSC